MGCGDSKNTSQNDHVVSPSKEPSQKAVKIQKIKGSLGNVVPQSYNESAKNIKKYFRDQIPPTDLIGEFTDQYFLPNEDAIFSMKEGSFIDKHASRTQAALGQFGIMENQVEWLRPDKIFPEKFCLFDDKIEYNDLLQGSIGNCYFLSAIAAITQYPELIVEVFRQHKVNENGYYEICMKINGEWQIVFIDDKIPCDKNTKQPIFAKPHGFELWVMLLEKAWAKVNDGYLNTVAGYPMEVLGAFTPFSTKQVWPLYAQREETFWNEMQEALTKGYLMAAGTNMYAEGVGLVRGHAYTILLVKEAIVKGEQLRLMRLRNPWGFQSYNGDWCDNSKRWNHDTKIAFGKDNALDANDGCFWMSYSDFMQYFVLFEFCYLIIVNQVDIYSTSNYSWVHKEIKLDMKHLCEHFDEKTFLRKHLQNLHEVKMKLIILTVPSLSDGIPVLFQSPYYFEETVAQDYYLVE